MIRIVLAAAALACAAAASPAMAHEPMVKVQGRVSHGDLDLSDPHHLAKLQARIEQAARNLCMDGIDKGWRDHPEVTACQARIVANARTKVAKLAAGAGNSSHLAEHR